MNGDDLFGLVLTCGIYLTPLIAVPLGLLYQKIRGRERALRAARAARAEVQEIFRRPQGAPIEHLFASARSASGAYEGRLASGRQARVDIGGQLTIAIDAPNALRISIRKKGLLDRWSFRRGELDFDRYLVAAPDRTLARRAFDVHSELRREVVSVFEALDLEQLMIWDGKLVARSRAFSWGGRDWELNISRLERIAAAFEPVPLAVRVLGGERKALRGFGGSPRCAYCHDGITGEEPDLVACERCQTVLHEGCWRDLGHCPVLGCDGRVAERARPEPPRERERERGGAA